MTEQEKSSLDDLRSSVDRDYKYLPAFLKKKIDRMFPERPFSSEDDEVAYLTLKQSKLASMWMGIYSICALLLLGGFVAIYDIIAWLFA